MRSNLLSRDLEWSHYEPNRFLAVWSPVPRQAKWVDCTGCGDRLPQRHLGRSRVVQLKNSGNGTISAEITEAPTLTTAFFFGHRTNPCQKSKTCKRWGPRIWRMNCQPISGNQWNCAIASLPSFKGCGTALSAQNAILSACGTVWQMALNFFTDQDWKGAVKL